MYVENAKIINNYRDGIRVTKGGSAESDYAVFVYGQKNTISQNGSNGIYAKGNVEIEIAQLKHNDDFGIYCRGGSVKINLLIDIGHDPPDSDRLSGDVSLLAQPAGGHDTVHMASDRDTVRRTRL